MFIAKSVAIATVMIAIAITVITKVVGAVIDTALKAIYTYELVIVGAQRRSQQAASVPPL